MTARHFDSMFVVPATPGRRPGFAHALARRTNVAVTPHVRTDFPSGEMIVSVPPVGQGAAVIVLTTTTSPADAVVEVALLADALRRTGVDDITCVLQYLPYSRSNRLNRPGLPLGAKVIVGMLETSAVTRFVVFDLHSRETLGYFGKPVTWVSTLEFMSSTIELNTPETVISPDRGRYDDCVTLALHRDCGVDMLVKLRRDDLGSSELAAGAHSDVSGRAVLLYDDEIWSGTTATNAARSLLAAGATRIDYLTVYDFTTPEVRQRLLDDVGVATFTTTNLARPALDALGGRYRVVDAASLLARRWGHLDERGGDGALIEVTGSG